MKLVFYFMTGQGRDASFSVEEREAEADERNGTVVGYRFEEIRDHGCRPFCYFQKEGVGNVVEYELFQRILCLEEKDKGKAKEILDDYFAKKIAKKAQESVVLIEERLAAKWSDVLNQAVEKETTPPLLSKLAYQKIVRW